MRILICNDDGINAEGIKVAEEAARSLSDDVWVVAPAFEQSGTGHSFTAGRTMTVKKVGDKHYTVEGTPTDCVIFACRYLLKDGLPDLVLSGVNQGSNLGFDVAYSGTIGAAIEGTLQGIRSIALSLYGAKNAAEEAYWETVRRYAPEVIKKLLGIGWSSGTLMNVNFPAVPVEKCSGIEFPVLSRRKIGDDVRVEKTSEDTFSFKVGFLRTEDDSPGADVEAVSRGAVTVTPVSVSFTDMGMLPVLKERFEV